MSTRSSGTSTKRSTRLAARANSYFVVCLSNDGYEVSLEPRKFYLARRDPDAEAHDQVRVVDESGEDYLFPAACFATPKISPNLRKLLLRAV
jgi:hypothetical protein